MRSAIRSVLLSLAAWWSRRRRVEPTEAEIRAHVYETRTARMGVRMTEFLRDRMRPRWLRLRRRPADSHPAPALDDRS